MEKKQISRFSSRRLFFLFDDVLAPFSFFPFTFSLSASTDATFPCTQAQRERSCMK